MKSRRRNRETPEMNTSSLPDIVFMILFFFMAIGMFPPPAPQIENDIVVYEGVELEDTGNYISLRVSKDEIQLGYDVIKFEELTDKIKEFDEDIVIIHIDDDTPIGFVKSHVEKAVLASGKSKIAYEVIKEKDEVQN